MKKRTKNDAAFWRKKFVEACNMVSVLVNRLDEIEMSATIGDMASIKKTIKHGKKQLDAWVKQ